MRGLFFAVLMGMFMFSGCGQKESSESTEPQQAQENWHIGQPLYEVYLRAFTPAGTLEGVLLELDRLQELGVKTVWLMPIHPVGFEGRKGSSGSPYSVRDYFAVGEEYGTGEDLKRLVNEVHKRDMKLILDVVINHSANDHVLMEEHPDWFARDSLGNFTREVADWWDITDWDHTNPEARRHLREALLYWVREFDVDGFRCDVAGMVEDIFWEEAIDSIRAVKPDAFMLAEWGEPRMFELGFDAIYDWKLYHSMRAHAEGKASLDSLWRVIRRPLGDEAGGELPMRFIENHDEPRSAEVFGWPGARPYAALIFTLPGIPLIYNGQEIGAEHKPSIFDPDPVHWEQGSEEVRRTYRRLATLRAESDVLRQGDYRRVSSGNESVLLFTRSLEGRKLLVAINFSGTEATTSPVPGGGQWVPLAKEDIAFHEDGSLTLAGYEWQIFTRQSL